MAGALAPRLIREQRSIATDYVAYGIYPDRATFERGLEALRAAGFRSSDISAVRCGPHAERVGSRRNTCAAAAHLMWHHARILPRYDHHLDRVGWLLDWFYRQRALRSRRNQ